MTTPIGSYHVDGYNLSSVIKKISNEGTAGTYETICDCKGDNWRENAKLISKALNHNCYRTDDVISALKALIAAHDADEFNLHGESDLWINARVAIANIRTHKQES